MAQIQTVQILNRLGERVNVNADEVAEYKKRFGFKDLPKGGKKAAEKEEKPAE